MNGTVMRLLLAEGVSRTGDAVTFVALPLTPVLVLNASPIELALIGVAQAVPILMLSLPAGAWVDRQTRRWPLLIGADLARAALLAAIPFAAFAGVLSMPVLLAVSFLSAFAGTVFDVAFAGWVPRLLSGDRLHMANARIELARSVSAVVGPGLGGALVALLSAPLALLADAISFVGSAVLVGSMRAAEPPWPRAVTAPSLRGELTIGLRFVARQPLIRAVVETAAINNLTRAIAMSVAILYLVDVARLSPAEIGLAFAVGHTGYLVGALMARRVTRRLGMGNAMQSAVTLFGPSMLLFAFAPPAFAGLAFAFMVFANGLGIALHNVNQVTVRQVLTPDDLRARVAAVYRTVIFGSRRSERPSAAWWRNSWVCRRR